MKLQRPPTIEEKAAAFDALCSALKDRGKFLHIMKRLKPPKPNQDGLEYEMVPIYEWTLRTEYHTDFVVAALSMVKPSKA
jgi:hypothetical protein